MHTVQQLYICMIINKQACEFETRCMCCVVQVETSEVCIPDFDYDTISWMLRYMYGCLELTPQHLSHARVIQQPLALISAVNILNWILVLHVWVKPSTAVSSLFNQLQLSFVGVNLKLQQLLTHCPVSYAQQVEAGKSSYCWGPAAFLSFVYACCSTTAGWGCLWYLRDVSLIAAILPHSGIQWSHKQL